MKSGLKAGVTRSERVRVDRERTIGFLGETLRVYSTPAMVSDIEYACYRLIQAHLDDGESSLGARVTVDHLGPTPLGAEVRVDVKVKAVEGRKVLLTAEVHDAAECVGRGEHLRIVVDMARHGERIGAKAKALDAGAG